MVKVHPPFRVPPLKCFALSGYKYQLRRKEVNKRCFPLFTNPFFPFLAVYTMHSPFLFCVFPSLQSPTAAETGQQPALTVFGTAQQINTLFHMDCTPFFGISVPYESSIPPPPGPLGVKIKWVFRRHFCIMSTLYFSVRILS